MSRTPTPNGGRRRPVHGDGAGPAQDRAGAAVGRHLPPGLVQPRPPGGQRQGAWRRVQPAADARRPADRGGRAGSDRGSPRAGEAQGAVRAGGGGDEPDAAARVHPDQHLARLGARLGPARPGALHHPRELQLQADRPAPGVRRLLAAAAAAAPSRVRIRLPGVRPPRASRRPAQFRPGDGTGAHQVELRED